MIGKSIKSIAHYSTAYVFFSIKNFIKIGFNVSSLYCMFLCAMKNALDTWNKKAVEQAV